MEEFKNQRKELRDRSSQLVVQQVLPNLEWISGFPLMRDHDNLGRLKFDIDAPCIVRWGLLRYAAPSRVTPDVVNDGRMLETYSFVPDVAL